MKRKYGNLIKDLNKKTVLGCYGTKQRKNQADVEIEYILFNDNKTILKLEEQDYYSYHDCSSSARILDVIISRELHQQIRTDTDFYGIANRDC